MKQSFKIFYLIYIGFIFFHLTKADAISKSINLNDEGKWVINDFSEENYIAKATYNATMMTIGTDTLSLTTNKLYNDELQAEAAGRLEGYLTQDAIYKYNLNFKGAIGEVDQQTKDFFYKQEDFIKNKHIEKPDDPYLYIAYLGYLQLKGIRDEYNEIAPQDKKIDDFDIMAITAAGDLTDVREKFSKIDLSKLSVEELREHFLKTNHCSAIFKAKENFEDIFIGHNTWDSYVNMYRILKEYNLNYNYPYVKAKNIIFSSYPATISSNDDFYITSQNLAVVETTNEFLNSKLFDLLTTESLFSYQRVMIANRMSSNAEEWGYHFKQYNSGTYNNQYMIFDMKKIDLTQGNVTMKEQIFYITETVPGYAVSHNATDYLKYGYWPSYNNAFDEKIRYLSEVSSEFNKNIKNVSDLMDYDTCNRAIIFRRDQHKVTDLETFKSLLRYNNYKHDVFGDPCNTISARCDLKPDDKKPSCAGAYDAKVMSITENLGKEKVFHFIAGPTDDVDKEEIFDFSTSKVCKDKVREGIPDKFNFGWIDFKNVYNMVDYE